MKAPNVYITFGAFINIIGSGVMKENKIVDFYLSDLSLKELIKLYEDIADFLNFLKDSEEINNERGELKGG